VNQPRPLEVVWSPFLAPFSDLLASELSGDAQTAKPPRGSPRRVRLSSPRRACCPSRGSASASKYSLGLWRINDPIMAVLMPRPGCCRKGAADRGQRGETAGAVASTRYLQRSMIDIELNNFFLRTCGQSFLVRIRAVRRTKTHAPITMNAKSQFCTAVIAAK
jgi:hypothetical protein